MAQTVRMPAYDRSRLTAGIVHIGLGNFHRAHLAVYQDDLFAQGKDHDWAIIGAGVRPADAKMRDALKAQGCLSTVIELDPKDKSARRIGSMIDFLPFSATNGPLILAMARAEIRIVSLTVTEGGYFVNPATGRFDPAVPEIQADARDPSHPGTAFGAIVASLKMRRAARVKPFTVMSCDNLPGNGNVARAAVVGLARLSDPDLADWIESNVAFPNGMVDRITPATGQRERDMAGGFGLGHDPVPVTCEPFRQWVLEDHFPAGRPAWEDVGVTFTSQVHAFETMKIRMLNGGHAVIAYPGGLMGIEYVHEAMADPLILGFLRKVEQEEVIPFVPPVPGTDLDEYFDLILERFSNPEVADTERRLCFDGFNRQPKFIIPSILDNLSKKRMPRGLILLSALWCRYCAGVADDGSVIEPNDPNWERLNATARQALSDPPKWFEMADIYGQIGRDAAVVDCFARFLQDISARGTRAVLADFIAV